jgi:arylsulfatase A-like enzyme
MGRVRNILFVMYDQLRFDYLSCAGHPHLKTPNFDSIAERGVRFTRAYTQSPVCGASRMCFYTGRYMQSHGAHWNNVPLRVGEMTLGDHLREIGAEAWLVGKTHMTVDTGGMDRLGLARDSVIGARVAECGFDTWVREDGLVGEGPEGRDPADSAYNRYLAAKGYGGRNPWHDHANSGIDADGNILSGWFMKNGSAAAHVREEDSETPWLTTEALRFLDSRPADAPPWVCHLSYIKPHWPYIVPQPWASMFGSAQVVPAVRHPDERVDPHPVFRAFMEGRIGQAFSRDEVREAVIPAYMGLIAQCDAEFGRILDYLSASGRMDDTMIVVTSDHGDYLGDHWLGEKDLFHEPSVRIPLIVYDPDPAADATRGTTCDALVEAIDLAPSFIDVLGGTPQGHILEGRSLLPWLRGPAPESWRRATISEYDYALDTVGTVLDVPPRDARLMMVFDGRWKLIHAEGGFRPMLFDLESDPDEFHDLGASADHSDTRARLYELLHRWSRRASQRITISDAQILSQRGREMDAGIHIGVWDEAALTPEARTRLTGRARPLP